MIYPDFKFALLLAGVSLFVFSCRTKPADRPTTEQPVVVQADQVLARTRVEVDDEVLRRYVGDYELLLDPSNEFSITEASGNLVLHSANNDPVVFQPENDTAFFSDPASRESLVFIERNGLYNFIMMNEKGYKLEARHLPE